MVRLSALVGEIGGARRRSVALNTRNASLKKAFGPPPTTRSHSKTVPVGRRRTDPPVLHCAASAAAPAGCRGATREMHPRWWWLRPPEIPLLKIQEAVPFTQAKGPGARCLSSLSKYRRGFGGSAPKADVGAAQDVCAITSSNRFLPAIPDAWPRNNSRARTIPRRWPRRRPTPSMRRADTLRHI